MALGLAAAGAAILAADRDAEGLATLGAEIAPGFFRTPLALRQAANEPEHFAAFVSRHPLGRAGQPHELVGPAVFLVSDASSDVTGHILTVDGGYVAQ